MTLIKFFSLALFCLMQHTQAGDLPDNIPLSFLLNGHEISLSLTKVEGIPPPSPDFINARTDLDTTSEGGSVYEDSEDKASFVVKTVLRDGVESRLFLGIVKDDDKMFSVKPAKGDETDVVKLEGADYFIKDVTDNPAFKKSTDVVASKRTKRDARIEMVVEVMMVADFSVFQKFMELSNNNKVDARSRILSYFAHVVNLVDVKFRSVQTSKYSYSVHMVDLYICETMADSMFTLSNEVQTGDGKIIYLKALEKFHDWIKNKPNIKHYDVASFSTLFIQGEGVHGIAYENCVCEDEKVCGVTDSGIIGTSLSLAHEIGHLLGSRHDILSGCKDSDQYIMTTSNTWGKNNHHTFSNCSIASFEKLMDKLEGNRLIPRATKNCLNKDNIIGQKKDITKELDKKMGLVYSPDQQCQALFGFTSKFCSFGKKSDELKCSELACLHPSTGKCRLSSGSFAWDGTPCGPNKWCINKECVYDVEAPSNTESCQQGDLTVEHANFKCSSVFQNPHYCYDTHREDQCCASCKKVETGYSECKYGDKNPQCSYVERVCDAKPNHLMCCNTCIIKANPEMPRPDPPRNNNEDINNIHQPTNGGDMNAPKTPAENPATTYNDILRNTFKKNCATFETDTSDGPNGKPSADLFKYCNNLKRILFPGSNPAPPTNTRPYQPRNNMGANIVTQRPESPINNKNVKCKPGDKDLIQSCPERYCLSAVYVNLCCSTCAGKY